MENAWKAPLTFHGTSMEPNMHFPWNALEAFHWFSMEFPYNCNLAICHAAHCTENRENARKAPWKIHGQCRINHGSGGSPEPGPLNSGAS